MTDYRAQIRLAHEMADKLLAEIASGERDDKRRGFDQQRRPPVEPFYSPTLEDVDPTAHMSPADREAYNRARGYDPCHSHLGG